LKKKNNANSILKEINPSNLYNMQANYKFSENDKNDSQTFDHSLRTTATSTLNDF
jgi:hypothetical protein